MTSRVFFFGRCIFFLFLFCTCNRKEAKVQRSFYYWRTVLQLSASEKEALQRLGVTQLHTRFFDVDWNGVTAAAEPIAKAVFADTLPPNLRITPVVFITQEPLRNLDSAGLNRLAQNIATLLANTATTHALRLSTEVQVDCDWTAQTKSAYFLLLRHLRQQPFFAGKTLSATIRLHQVKFLSEAGIPPVDRGLLMCYNMGNLRQAKTTNSIIDEEELRKYISNLDRYPLPLDVALPLFDWWVLFEGNEYKGLLREFSPKAAPPEKVPFARDTSISGYTIKKGQWLRHERSAAAVVQRCADLVAKKLGSGPRTVILYHLDDRNLRQYNLHELENFYNRLR